MNYYFEKACLLLLASFYALPEPIAGSQHDYYPEPAYPTSSQPRITGNFQWVYSRAIYIRSIFSAYLSSFFSIRLCEYIQRPRLF